MRKGLLILLLLLPVAAAVAAAPPAQVTPSVPPVPLPQSDPPPAAELTFDPLTVPAPEGEPSTERVWVRAEYLLWWIEHDRMPPLIGTVSASQAANLGNLPAGAIHPLAGDAGLSFGSFSGGRFTAGGWLDPDQQIGIDGNFFFLEQRNANFQAATPGDPVIGPLFKDVVSGSLFIITPVDPAHATEDASIHATERLWGTEANVRHRFVYFGQASIDLLAGFRYLQLDEDLSKDATIHFLPDYTRSWSDEFDTRNQFYGGQVGAEVNFQEGAWTWTLAGKLALGGVDELVTINGLTTEGPVTGPKVTVPGGILAQPSNIGQYHHSHFAVLPEVTLNLGYQITEYLRAYVGYNFLYLSQAIRPAGAIDFSVNPAKVPSLIINNPSPINRPLPNFGNSDLWVQGINFGLEFKY